MAAGVTPDSWPPAKADLYRSLVAGRQAVLWKLDGLAEYDARRPLVPTGTNLLGLVKHLALVEAGYFGTTFGRPFPEPLEGFEADADPNSDLWARADETRDEIVGLYRRVWAHADATIEALPLEATGTVPWWPAERNPVRLHQILVHVATETHRHAGHADIVRELVDGTVGLSAARGNIGLAEGTTWRDHRDRVEAAAQSFRTR